MASSTEISLTKLVDIYDEAFKSSQEQGDCISDSMLDGLALVRTAVAKSERLRWIAWHREREKEAEAKIIGVASGHYAATADAHAASAREMEAENDLG